MLKSILKKKIMYENKINRTKIKQNTKIKIIIMCILFILLLIVISFYKGNQYNSSLGKVINTINTLLVNYGFNLQNIYITGEKNISKEVILNTVNFKKYNTIFDVDLLIIYNNLLLNEWIKTIEIERVLPNAIKIKIVEKKPIAIWQNKLGNKLITENGSIISVANPNIYKNQLPIIIGEEGKKNTFQILKMLKKVPELYKNVWSISYINKRRWDVYLKQGITVLLPKDKIDDAWEKIYVLHKKYKILDIGLTEIDLRNENQIFGKINFDKKLFLKRKQL